MREHTDDYYVQALADLVSHKWVLPILYTLKDGSKRYGEIHRLYPGMAEKMLTETLHKLHWDGYILRTAYPEVPPKVEYRLSDLGESLVERIAPLIEWMAAHNHEIQAVRRTNFILAKEKGTTQD